MYNLSRIPKLFNLKIKSVLFSSVNRNLKPKNRLFSDQKSLDVNTNVIKDVVLYKYENPRFFKVLNIFSICQFGFWSYLSLFAYSNLRDAPVNPNLETAWWRRFNLGENKYKNTMTVLFFFIGWGILAISWMYTLRSVRYLVLRKGGKDVTIVTYTPMGQNRMFTLNLNNVSAREVRTMAKTQLPIKVKGHRFYYLLDMKGEFKNPSLFDNTAGLRRKLN